MHFRKLITSDETALPNEVNIKRKRTSTLEKLNNLISLKVLTSSKMLLSFLHSTFLCISVLIDIHSAFRFLIMCGIASEFLRLHIFDVFVVIL